jgi:hypothetical protein
MLKELHELKIGDVFINRGISSNPREIYTVVINIFDDGSVNTFSLQGKLLRPIILKKMSFDISKFKGLNITDVQKLSHKIQYNIIENIYGKIPISKDDELLSEYGGRPFYDIMIEFLSNYPERHLDIKIEQIFQ